jgi:hypothetical protein
MTCLICVHCTQCQLLSVPYDRAKKWGTVNTLFVVMRYMTFSIRMYGCASILSVMSLLT